LAKEIIKMPDSQYERYLVREPLYESFTGIKNRQSPTMTFLSTRQVPEANYYLQLGWIYGIPQPNPQIQEHTHDYDEILLIWGGNPEKPQKLGAEIELQIGGQPIVFNTTTCIFFPRGIPHGPLTWKKFSSPHVQMSLMLGTGSPPIEGKFIKEVRPESNRFDYEQYVVRSPIREAGRGYYKSGRQCPTMTYMSEDQVNAAKYYLEFGWIWDIVKPNIGEMVHNRVDEIVVHLGGDPQNPEDLGADLEIGIGGELFTINSSSVAFLPKGMRHGPLTWKKVRKPHIEMAIMLGAGSYKEGWDDAFFDKYSHSSI
jgi:hypothetical protein